MSVIWPLVTFRGKLFFEVHSSNDTGSIDTGFGFVSCRGAEKKGRQTDFEYYIYIDRYLSHLGFILSKSDKTFDLSELPHIPYTLDNLFR